MAKPFLTYEQQLDKLIHEKKLTVADNDYALALLKDIGYFALIGGYKNPFIDPMTRLYTNGVAIEDIHALYSFDSALRELVFHYICIIERKIRQLISYSFCNAHGEQQSSYLDPANYSGLARHRADITKLISILAFHADRDNEHPYLVHQRNT